MNVLEKLKASEAMSKNPLVVRESDAATRARSIFKSCSYRSLPVTNDREALTGIITRKDVMKVTSTRSNIRVGGLMSKSVLYALPAHSIAYVAKAMLAANVGRVPIVSSEAEKKVVGIISAEDILRTISKLNPKSAEKPVAGIMKGKVVTCTPKTPVSAVWAKMLRNEFSGMPVVDKKVVGMLTRKNIIEAGFARIGREGEKGRIRNSTRVERLMTTPAITLSPNDTVRKAAELMLRHNIGRLPVVEGRKLVGIISRGDILRTFLRGD